MTTIRSTQRHINAPVAKVFDAVAHIGKFKEIAPHISKVEILSDVEKGVGLKFRETRVMNGREAATVLDCTEYVENERVRMVADQGGVIWDTLMTTVPKGEGTELAMEMEARPYKFMSRLITPLIMGTVSKAVEADIDVIADYCEGAAHADG